MGHDHLLNFIRNHIILDLFNGSGCSLIQVLAREHPENIAFVRVADEPGKKPCPLVAWPDSILVVVFHRKQHDPAVLFIQRIQKTAVLQDLYAQIRMIDTAMVDKRPVLSELLEPADIVIERNRMRKKPVMFVQAKPCRQFIHDPAHLDRMIDFQMHPAILMLITRGILKKRFRHLFLPQ